MADPKDKYAGLPGIAPPDEKDVYETEDLPEADQDDYMAEPESENIDRPSLNARTAHERFRGKWLVAGQYTDFSDRASRHPNIGYQAISGDWEIAAVGEPETLQQRRHRLEAEMRLLIDDLSKLKSEGDATMAETLVPELEASLRQLSQIRIPETVGVLTATPSPHIANIENIVKQLKGDDKKKKGDVKTSGGAEPLLTYQLNAFPAQTQFVKSARVADLELRLKQLETVIGSTPENLNRLQLSEFKSVTEAAMDLSARTNVLDLSTIDLIDAKLGILVSKMDACVEKRGGPQQAELEAKINELYESYKKVQALTDSLLPLADRLTALSALHGEASEFKKNLAQLKVEMSNMGGKIAADEALLNGVQIAMKELMQTVSTNIESFNNRLSALQK